MTKSEASAINEFMLTLEQLIAQDKNELIDSWNQSFDLVFVTLYGAL